MAIHISTSNVKVFLTYFSPSVLIPFASKYFIYFKYAYFITQRKYYFIYFYLYFV